MSSGTALGAEERNNGKIIFISKAHEDFYYEHLKKVRYQDAYHKALIYCLGICNDTRQNVNRIYDFKTGFVKPECLQEGWQTSGSARVTRMAFNLYCNGMPSVSDDMDEEEQLMECRRYTVRRNRRMLKVRLMGKKKDIRQFESLLKEIPEVELLEFSDLYSNKGTRNYYRAYAEIEMQEDLMKKQKGNKSCAGSLR